MKCGIVDVGSNTMRLSIYQYDAEGFKLLLNKKEMAGLAGYVRDGALSPEGINVACTILSGFRALLENFGIEDLHVFATASLRNVTNTSEAVETIRALTGLAVEVVSGAEEAQLSFLGASAGLPHASGLLADIGGGSTELVTYEDGKIKSSSSLPIGSLSLFSRYVENLFPTAEESKAIRRRVNAELTSATVQTPPCSHLLGVGGTIRAAGKMCNDLTRAATDNPLIPAEQIRDLYRQLKRADKTTLRQILRSVPDRVHTLIPGLIILNSVIKTFAIDTVIVSAWGVREGYLIKHVMGKEN